MFEPTNDRTSRIGGAARQVDPSKVKSLVIPWRDITRSNILF